jgi:farnesyl diphosphate synthase
VATAMGAGFILVPVAAQILAESAAELGLRREALGQMAVELFRASGIEGMVGGQWRDLEAEQRHLGLDELVAVHRGKTGALIRASCALGGMAAGAGPVAVAALAAFGEDIGLAFQVADDVLDATGTSAQLGKTAGRDAVLQKSTYVLHLGVEGAAREARALAARAVEHLDRAGVPSTSLGELARYIVSRES